MPQDPSFSIIRQQTLDWLKASGYSRAELAKELAWSESYLSDVLSAKCNLSALNFCKLSNTVMQSPKVNKPNRGARICGIQSLGKAVKGVLELHADTMELAREQHTENFLNDRR
jgi:transcriptional regulator with XRE-family HTH domain